MKKALLFLVFAVVCGLSAGAQEFNQYQGRSIEPLQDVFVRPLTVDMQLIKTERQSYGPYHFNVEVNKMSVGDIETIKINAIYLASEEEDADMIVATTFRIQTPKKGGGLDVIVNGYPVKYINWRSFGRSIDGKSQMDEDYLWISSLLNAVQIRPKDGGEKKDASVKKN